MTEEHKEKYTELEVEVIHFENVDVIITSFTETRPING